MFTLTLTALRRGSQFLRAFGSFMRGLFAGIRALFAGIDESRAIAGRYEALSRMTDSELAERGIARSDIPQVALQGAKSS